MPGSPTDNRLISQTSLQERKLRYLCSPPPPSSRCAERRTLPSYDGVQENISDGILPKGNSIAVNNWSWGPSTTLSFAYELVELEGDEKFTVGMLYQDVFEITVGYSALVWKIRKSSLFLKNGIMNGMKYCDYMLDLGGTLLIIMRLYSGLCLAQYGQSKNTTVLSFSIEGFGRLLPLEKFAPAIENF